MYVQFNLSIILCDCVHTQQSEQFGSNVLEYGFMLTTSACFYHKETDFLPLKSSKT